MTILPHSPYVTDVHAHLADEGIEAARTIVTTPDGVTLDAVIEFHDRDVDETEWPDGVYLGWDQHTGWTLTTTGSSRTVYPLDLATYADAGDVAAVTAAQLRGQPTPALTGRIDSRIEELITAWQNG